MPSDNPSTTPAPYPIDFETMNNRPIPIDGAVLVTDGSDTFSTTSGDSDSRRHVPFCHGSETHRCEDYHDHCCRDIIEAELYIVGQEDRIEQLEMTTDRLRGVSMAARAKIFQAQRRGDLWMQQALQAQTRIMALEERVSRLDGERQRLVSENKDMLQLVVPLQDENRALKEQVEIQASQIAVLEGREKTSDSDGDCWMDED
jgi:chromosome segregation ATPase